MALIFSIEGFHDAWKCGRILFWKRHRLIGSHAGYSEFAAKAGYTGKASDVALPPKIFPVDFYPDRHIVFVCKVTVRQVAVRVNHKTYGVHTFL